MVLYIFYREKHLQWISFYILGQLPGASPIVRVFNYLWLEIFPSQFESVGCKCDSRVAYSLEGEPSTFFTEKFIRKVVVDFYTEKCVGCERLPKNVTVSISDEIAAKMDGMRDVNWSEVCRRCISEYIEARKSNRGEFIKDVERFMRSKLDCLTYEDRIALCDAEIERFTRKWGKPDVIQYDDRPGIKMAYVILRKRQDVNIGGKTLTKVRIRNDYAPPTYNEFLKPTDIVKFKPDKWKGFADGHMDLVVDYFKSKGYTVGEYQGTWMMLIADCIADGNADLALKEKARDLTSTTSYSFLLALDKEDIVFLSYRKTRYVLDGTGKQKEIEVC